MDDGSPHPHQKYKRCNNIDMDMDMDTALATTGNSNSSNTMSDKDPPESSATFLQHLRERGFYREISSLEKMTAVVQNQSKFPLKIRETIQVATDEHGQNPEEFCNTVSFALKELLLCEPKVQTTGNGKFGYIWNGLDSEVDTEEEVEVAIRVFPNAFLHLILKGYECFFFLESSLESLPFVPLILELGTELKHVWENEWLRKSELEPRQLISNLVKYLRFYSECGKRFSDEDLDRRLDETCFAFLFRMREKGFLSTYVSTNCRIENDIIRNVLFDILFVRSSRSEKTVRFLIDLNPNVLKFMYKCGPPLLWDFSWSNLEESIIEQNRKDSLKRFQALFKLTMSHYPGGIDFLFDHRYSDCFQTACRALGSNEVITVFGEIISKSTLEQFQTIIDLIVPGRKCRGSWVKIREPLAEIVWKSAQRRSEKILALVVTAASHDSITLDDLHFLIRRDPAAVFAQIHDKVMSH